MKKRMPRELTRTKPKAEPEEEHPGGLEEFKDNTMPREERVTKEGSPSLTGGWSSDIRPRSQGKAAAPRFTVPDDGEEVLIKFVEDKPFAPLFQHWTQTSDGRRAFTCAGEGCPMCARGDKPKSSDWINVVVLGDTPELKVWYMSPDPAEAVKERAKSKRTSPLDRDGLYFAVSKKKGSNGFFSYSVDPVKEDELEEDWGVKPLTTPQFDQFHTDRYDSSIVRFHTVAELQEAARKFLGDE